MKIIKEFQDNDYAKKAFYLSYEPGEIVLCDWHWGLGDDGELYIKSNNFGNSVWYEYRETSFRVSIKDMKKIVKKFGHLLVFI